MLYSHWWRGEYHREMLHTCKEGRRRKRKEPRVSLSEAFFLPREPVSNLGVDEEFLERPRSDGLLPAQSSVKELHVHRHDGSPVREETPHLRCLREKTSLTWSSSLTDLTEWRRKSEAAVGVSRSTEKRRLRSRGESLPMEDHRAWR